VFLSFLFIFCFFVLVPITIGFFVSLVLRELYKQQLWEKSIADKNNDNEVEETAQEGSVKLYDPSLDEMDSETNTEQVPNEESDAAEQIAAVSDSELNTETESVTSSAISDPFPPNTITESENDENRLSSVFEDENILPDTFKINDIIDEMVNENPPIIPSDLSLRIEEDGHSENLINQIENEHKQDMLDADENEILTKMIAPTDSADSNNQPFAQPEMMFNHFNNEENPDTVHSEISPMAVELLGEDFNFDSFFEEKKSEQKNNESNNKSDNESITAYEIGQGIYQADGGFMTNDSTLFNLLPKEQAIVSLYPDNLIQNAVVEPDLSETAQNYNFTEELLPMFIRKRNKK
jgi:hypothetical protein